MTRFVLNYGLRKNWTRMRPEEVDSLTVVVSRSTIPVLETLVGTNDEREKGSIT